MQQIGRHRFCIASKLAYSDAAVFAIVDAHAGPEPDRQFHPAACCTLPIIPSFETRLQPLPTGLRETVYDLLQQGVMLVYCWKKPSDVEEIMSQALYTGSATIYQLLAMDFSDAKHGSEREKFALTEREKLEVSRLAMTLWSLLMRNLARKGNGARGIMDHIPVFKISPADAKKRCWPPGIVEPLGAWDATRRPDSRPKQLIRVTQAIEECTEVKLGHFIERVFEIREGHEKKSVATLWMEDV